MSSIHKRDAKGRIVKGGSVGGKNDTSFKPGDGATENFHPEMVADLIVSMAEDPGESIHALARACGMKESTATDIVKRMNMRYQPVIEEVKRATSDSLIKQIEEKLPMLLDGIDQKKVDAATLRDIAVAVGVLTEKRQLLKGEPTQIMTFEERLNMDKLGPALLKELERRDLVVDVSYREIPTVQVLPPDVVPDAALSKTVAAKDRRENRAKNR